VAISTHVLDATAGRPAAGLGLMAGLDAPEPGDYRIVFDTGSYQPDGFYPEVAVTFRVTEPAGHYHVPLLLSPFSYSTYRGS
jgi:5-hydroxyisourate hydrolase